MLRGWKVTLRKADESDRRKVYEWLAHSDLTSSYLGPPRFPDHPIPTWEEFRSHFCAHYFDDGDAFAGRSYIILSTDEEIGMVGHNRIDMVRKETEMDIWLARRVYAGQGYGPDALETLCTHLRTTYGIQLFISRPSARNHRAISAFEKAGFRLLSTASGDEKVIFSPGYYVDSVIMVKIGPPAFIAQPSPLPRLAETSSRDQWQTPNASLGE